MGQGWAMLQFELGYPRPKTDSFSCFRDLICLHKTTFSLLLSLLCRETMAINPSKSIQLHIFIESNPVLMI